MTQTYGCHFFKMQMLGPHHNKSLIVLELNHTILTLSMLLHQV